jgi:hypothetical protein
MRKQFVGSLRGVFPMRALSKQARNLAEKHLCGDGADRDQRKSAPRRSHSLSPLIHFF